MNFLYTGSPVKMLHRGIILFKSCLKALTIISVDFFSKTHFYKQL